MHSEAPGAAVKYTSIILVCYVIGMVLLLIHFVKQKYGRVRKHHVLHVSPQIHSALKSGKRCNTIALYCKLGRSLCVVFASKVKMKFPMLQVVPIHQVSHSQPTRLSNRKDTTRHKKTQHNTTQNDTTQHNTKRHKNKIYIF